MEASSTMANEGDEEPAALVAITLQEQVQFPPRNARQKQHVSITVNLENSEQEDAVCLTIRDEHTARQEIEMGDSIQRTGQTASLVGDEEQQASNPPPAMSYDDTNYSGPEGVANLLRYYPFVIGLIITVWKLTLEIPALNPLTIMSAVAYLTALLIHIIMSCMYDLLLNPTRQPGRLLYPRHYMILKYSFYPMCFLAYFSLLPILFILYYHQK